MDRSWNIPRQLKEVKQDRHAIDRVQPPKPVKITQFG
jgi:hypothetical protein